MEIELKWLVDESKFKSIKDKYCKSIIRTSHYYMNDNSDKWSIRFSKYKYFFNDDFKHEIKYKITLKDKGLISRNEIICDISEKEFNEAISIAYSYIKKDRHICYIDNVMYEVDIYDDYNFITCEVEFATLEDLKKFKMPEWCKKDVTTDVKYKNINLAKQIHSI